MVCVTYVAINTKHQNKKKLIETIFRYENSLIQQDKIIKLKLPLSCLGMGLKYGTAIFGNEINDLVYLKKWEIESVDNAYFEKEIWFLG